MAEVNTLQCDECRKMRLTDSNHWMEGVMDGSEIRIALVGRLTGRDGLPELKSKKKHFCGQECAMKWVGVKLGDLRG